MALDEIRKTKLEKLEKLKKAGIDPYPSVSGRTHTIAQALENFDKFSESKEELTLAGRVMARRDMGGAIFFDLRDDSGKIQGFIKEDIVGKEIFSNFSDLTDIGDFIEISGTLFKTKKEEKTLEVKKPLPSFTTIISPASRSRVKKSRPLKQKNFLRNSRLSWTL